MDEYVLDLSGPLESKLILQGKLKCFCESGASIG